MMPCRVGAAALVVLVMLGGCAAPGADPRPAAFDADAAQCRIRFVAVDERIVEAGLRDGAAAPVAGFPNLRMSRALVAARPPVDSAAFVTWAQRARSLDARARAFEMANLGLDVAEAATLQRCADAWLGSQLADPRQRRALAAAVRVADDYDLGSRILGLYPLASMGMLAGVERLRAGFAADFRMPLAALPVHGRLVRFVPAPSPPGLRAGSTALVRDPLGWPAPEAAQLEALFAEHAPVFEVDVRTPDDRIGTMVLSTGGQPRLSPDRPVVYRRHGVTRIDGRWLLQLEYWAWFRARPRTGALDILGGPLDGLIWRVTLDLSGQAIAYDSIHPCGCYHLVMTTDALTPRAAPQRYEEPLLRMPPPGAGNGRVVLRIASGSHYLQRAYRYHSGDHSGDDSGAGVVYGVRDYDELRSLALPGGGRRSLFRPDGLVPASARPERWLLWMSGVRSAGAMRQAGRHAIAFVGRRHFDDPDLLDRFFRRTSP